MPLLETVLFTLCKLGMGQVDLLITEVDEIFYDNKGNKFRDAASLVCCALACC